MTGARGLLGMPLSRRLAERHEVHAMDLPEFDVTDADAVARIVAAVRPDRVVNLAAVTDVDGCERDESLAHRVNAVGARNVAAACRAEGAPMLQVSTDYVFDGTSASPWVESDVPRPLSAYGRSKLAGELAVREFAPRWAIVRAQSLYGAGKKSFPDAILARARSGQPLRVVTDQRVSPTWVEDLAVAIVAILDRGSEGVYHVANAGSCTWYECARATLDLSGLADVAIGETTAADLARPAPRPAYSVFNCSRFAQETGAGLRSWRDALAAYLSEAAAREAHS
ncbi:MAG: dTDP-4-dehydrorhamnose reductase [Planctomycetes bacterium]|nr:dTDP-4-dehydrorhamnose reductase [Planctomycetota bacterium]